MIKITHESGNLKKLFDKIINEESDKIAQEEIKKLKREDLQKGKKKNYVFKKKKIGSEIEITINEKNNPTLKGIKK